MTTEEEEKRFFRDVLLSKPSWAGLEGSEQVDILTSYVGKRLAAFQFQVEASRREDFLQLAQERESITARAESEGYIPNLPSPFELEVEVKNNGEARVFLPFRFELAASDQTPLALSEETWLEADETKTVKAQELSKEVKTFASSASPDIFQEFVIGGIDENGFFTIHDFTVRIEGETWSNVQNFRNGESDSLIYHMFYKVGDELAFRLGNGEVGKIPEPNSEIEVEIWHTQGENAFVASGQNLLPLDTGDPLTDVEGEQADLKFASGNLVRKGQPLEPQETIRKSVLTHIQQGPMAARNVDYEHNIGRAFPELLYLKVWGEQEQRAKYGDDSAYINRAFFTFLLKRQDGEEQTAYDARMAAMRDDALNYWNTVIKPMNVAPVYVTLEELDFGITVKGKIDQGESLSKVESEITKLLLAVFGRYSNPDDFLTLFGGYSNARELKELFTTYGGRAGKVQESDIHDAIKATGYFVNKFPQSARRIRPGFEVVLSGNLEADFFDKYIYLNNVLFEDGEGNAGLAYVPNF